MFDLFNEILQTMRTNKLRTILTGIAVAWGIFMLIVLLGFAKGVRTAFEDSPMGQTSNVLQLWSGRTSMPFNGLGAGRTIPVRERDMKALRHDIVDNVSAVSGVLEGNTVVMRSDSSSISSTYSGVYPIMQREEQLRVSNGRFINDRDVNDASKVVVLEERNATTLFGSPQRAIGRILDINGLAFKVVGTYEHRWISSVFIPYSCAKAMNGFSDVLGTIRVNVEGMSTQEEAEAIERSIRESIGRSESFHPDDQSAIWIWNRFSNYLSQQTAMSVLNWIMWIIGLLTLITGVVGVSNIMFVSVRERTHEIGIRRAIGARPRYILTQIILEGVVITTLFGYVGILLGTIAGEIMAYAFADVEFIKDPRVDVGLAFQVTALLVVAGAFAGFFPAMRTLKIRPVEALRTE